jgi:hypothetical protein
MWARVILRSRLVRRVLRDVIVAVLLAVAAEFGGRRPPRHGK